MLATLPVLSSCVSPAASVVDSSCLSRFVGPAEADFSPQRSLKINICCLCLNPLPGEPLFLTPLGPPGSLPEGEPKCPCIEPADGPGVPQLLSLCECQHIEYRLCIGAFDESKEMYSFVTPWGRKITSDYKAVTLSSC